MPGLYNAYADLGQTIRGVGRDIASDKMAEAGLGLKRAQMETEAAKTEYGIQKDKAEFDQNSKLFEQNLLVAKKKLEESNLDIATKKHGLTLINEQMNARNNPATLFDAGIGKQGENAHLVSDIRDAVVSRSKGDVEIKDNQFYSKSKGRPLTKAELSVLYGGTVIATILNKSGTDFDDLTQALKETPDDAGLKQQLASLGPEEKYLGRYLNVLRGVIAEAGPQFEKGHIDILKEKAKSVEERIKAIEGGKATAQKQTYELEKARIAAGGKRRTESEKKGKEVVMNRFLREIARRLPKEALPEGAIEQPRYDKNKGWVVKVQGDMSQEAGDVPIDMTKYESEGELIKREVVSLMRKDPGLDEDEAFDKVMAERESAKQAAIKKKKESDAAANVKAGKGVSGGASAIGAGLSTGVEKPASKKETSSAAEKPEKAGLLASRDEKIGKGELDFVFKKVTPWKVSGTEGPSERQKKVKETVGGIAGAIGGAYKKADKAIKGIGSEPASRSEGVIQDKLKSIGRGRSKKERDEAAKYLKALNPGKTPSQIAELIEEK